MPMPKIHVNTHVLAHVQLGNPTSLQGIRLSYLERPRVGVNWKQNVTIGCPLGDLMPPWVERHWGRGNTAPSCTRFFCFFFLVHTVYQSSI